MWLAFFLVALGQGLLLRYWVGQVYEVGVASEFLVFTFLTGASAQTNSAAYAAACVSRNFSQHVREEMSTF